MKNCTCIYNFKKYIIDNVKQIIQSERKVKMLFI